MKLCPHRLIMAALAAGCALFIGCNQNSGVASLSPEEQQELNELRQQTREISRLGAEIQQLDKLRRDSQELAGLKQRESELQQLQAENQKLRATLAEIRSRPRPAAPAVAQAPANDPHPQVIQNLPNAFAEAAQMLQNLGAPSEEELPQKGDTIFIDKSVIGLLIPEFATNADNGPFEISGWLTSKGVLLQSYQQFNLLGITNYAIRRAPPELPVLPE